MRKASKRPGMAGPSWKRRRAAAAQRIISGRRISAGGICRPAVRRESAGGAQIPLVEHPGSVVVVALDADELVAVRQTRPGARGQTLELPSGKLGPGETPAQAAGRGAARG